MRAEEINILESFETLAATDPEHVILSEGDPSSDITVHELDIQSGKVYRYLKEYGIGKEDMVNIILPRGTKPFIALLGVWKAGAAAVVLDDDSPKDRVAYIQKDCDCKFVLDIDAWNDIQRCQPLKGHEPLDLHAAAFAVYTSGTTGNPKGVLHEYGSLHLNWASQIWKGTPIFQKHDRFAYVFSLSFVSLMLCFTYSLVCGDTVYIIPLSTFKNHISLKNFFIQNHISVATLPPSVFRFIDNRDTYLKKVFLGGDTANGFWKPAQEMRLFNVYASSESAALVTVAALDHPSDIAPIGKPMYDIEHYILKDDGTKAGIGESGEFCYEVPFTRGYINLPEQTSEAFINGIFHSGDLARWNENGEIEILGRISDTLKINGNRVEPAEVENAVMHVTGLKWAGVRGFHDGERSYLCAYHVDDTDFDVNSLREKLSEMLPSYMLPSYFMKIDSIPRNANGKLDRKALPKPNIESYRAEYKAPDNELERLICDSMADILTVGRVGVNDDFYLLGGDSIASMRLIAAVNLPGLDVSDIFQGRTAGNIARLYANRQLEAKTDRDRAELALEIPHLLNSEQRYMFDCQLYTPKSTMYNLFQLNRVTGTEPEVLARALDKTIRNHPSLLTELFFNEDGYVSQRYAPEKMPETKVEYVTKKCWEELRDNLVQPFKMIGGLMYRSRVFSVEGTIYFFFDVHHIIFDGYSAGVFFASLEKNLAGETPKPDYYYYVLGMREKALHSEQYQKAMEYFQKTYADKQWVLEIKPDYETRENAFGDMELHMNIPESDFAELKAKTGLSKNGVFVAAGLLALSRVTGANNVLLEWVYNGRDTVEAMQSVGIFFNSLPAALVLNEEITLGEICTRVRDQIDKAVQNRVYPFFDFYDNVIPDNMLCIIYQEGIRNYKPGGILNMTEETTRHNHAASEVALGVEVWDEEGGQCVYMSYSASKYRPETIENFGKIFAAMVKSLTCESNGLDTTLREMGIC